MRTCMPCPKLMAKSGEGRGSIGAAVIGEVSRARAAITRKKRIASVYRRGQTFHAGNYGAFAAQFEAAVVLRARDCLVSFRSDGHLFPLLGQQRAIGGEILAGGVFAIPLHC